MTREEAIKTLKGEAWICCAEKWNEALDMAIKSLEQEPCEDAISRQAVLDLTRIKIHNNWGNVIKESVDVEDIRQLPPVTPKPKTGHWIKTLKAVMGEGYMWYCDKCEHQVYQDSSKNYPSEKYCPNCGAKMVKPEESEDKG